MDKYSVKLMSRALRDLDGANRGYRQLFVENYTAIFRIDEAKKTVIVVTVRYSPSEF